MLTSTIRSYRPTHRERPSGYAFLLCKNASGRRLIAKRDTGSLDKLETFLRPEKCDSKRDVSDGKEEQAEEGQNHRYPTESHRQTEGREHEVFDRVTHSESDIIGLRSPQRTL